ncbi:MAG TPA: Wzt carbohydrate-binding domain-containing protein, partial [Rhizomicrobium sp.]|nr:Wzt carbohydrate-binding domain-containing protein [Rhizomicrobium sp.]
VRELGPAADVCARYLASVAERSDAEAAKARPEPAERWKPLEAPPIVRDVRGQRHNGISVSSFSADAPWHGHGGARIIDVAFRDPAGETLYELNGGAEVKLSILCHAEINLAEPIVGFMLRDRLGQNVFGDSTFLSCKDSARAMHAGEDFVAEFVFQLPFLARGEYALTVAITEGTQQDHTHVHWIEEALMLEVQESPVARGIIGVPALAIEVEKHTSGNPVS